MGRPRKVELNQGTREDLVKLGAIMCTWKEVAAWFDISEPTLKAWFDREPEAKELYEQGKDKGRISLRRSQFQLANKNATMAIFLGLNYLDQKDRRAIAVGGDADAPPIRLESLTDAQVDILIKRLEDKLSSM